MGPFFSPLEHPDYFTAPHLLALAAANTSEVTSGSWRRGLQPRALIGSAAPPLSDQSLSAALRSASASPAVPQVPVQPEPPRWGQEAALGDGWSFQLDGTAAVKRPEPSVRLPALRIAPTFDGGAPSAAVMSRPPATFCHSRLLFLSVVCFSFSQHPKTK